MAGFLGLGGGSSESYFLEPDDAKSMGDIEYMRTPKKVKRTFAKSVGWGNVEASEKVVSAYDEQGGVASSGGATPSYAPSTTPTFSTPSFAAPATPAAAPVTQAPAATEAPVAETTEAAPAPEQPAPEQPAAVEAAPAPAAASDGMDMFRSMARKIR